MTHKGELCLLKALRLRRTSRKAGTSAREWAKISPEERPKSKNKKRGRGVLSPDCQ